MSKIKDIKRGRITIIMAEDEMDLWGLYRDQHDMHGNKELCKLLKIPEKVKPLDYMVWTPHRDGPPNKISIISWFVGFQSGQIKNLIFLTNNIFTLHEINTYLLTDFICKNSRRYFDVYSYKKGKLTWTEMKDGKIVYPDFIHEMYSKYIKEDVLNFNYTMKK